MQIVEQQLICHELRVGIQRPSCAITDLTAKCVLGTDRRCSRIVIVAGAAIHRVECEKSQVGQYRRADDAAAHDGDVGQVHRFCQLTDRRQLIRSGRNVVDQELASVGDRRHGNRRACLVEQLDVDGKIDTVWRSSAHGGRQRFRRNLTVDGACCRCVDGEVDAGEGGSRHIQRRGAESAWPDDAFIWHG